MSAISNRTRNGQWEASAQQNNKMNGVVEGAYRLNMDRLQVLNDRIYERNVPSSVLQQQFSQRPVSTKYTMLPLVDTYKESSVPTERQPIYKQQEVFNPGTSAPFSGYVNAINDESRLRNQFFALQNCEQSVYVPSSQSDLYNVNIPQSQTPKQKDGDGLQYDDRSLLFKESEFSSFNPNLFHLGRNLFDNHTRQQLKGVSDGGSGNIRLGNNSSK